MTDQSGQGKEQDMILQLPLTAETKKMLEAELSLRNFETVMEAET